MFKKPASVAFKGETRLRGKEAKKLREAVAVQLGGEEVASALLPGKADILARKAGGGSAVQFVFADGACVLVQPDGRADLGEAELLPSLLALWRVGADVLPCVLLQPAVARFISRGANVMAPGIRAVQPVRGGAALPASGALVAVRVVGNPAACAIGRLRLPAAQLGVPGSKGEAVEVLHHFGDALWEVSGSSRPQGFAGDEIAITDAQEAAELLGAASLSGAGEDGVAAPAAAVAADVAAPTVCAGVEQEAAGLDEAGPEDMDRYLVECFLQAAKTRVKDRDLPMAGNALYAQHMRACRRAGSSLDVKASSRKKLAPLLAHLEELGYLALKKGAADPVVTRIFRDHPDVAAWRPWPRSATAEAESEAGAGSADGSAPAATIAIEMVWRVGGRLAPLLGALGSDAAPVPEDGCWTREQFSEALRRYADARELWLKNNRKRIGLDELLLGLAGEGDASSHLDGLVDRVLKSAQACHRVSAPQGGAQGGVRRTVRPGRPPLVQVRTDTRRGHAVTLAHGLEAYGVDMEALAACLQRALAASASIEREPQVAVVVQGFWDVAMAEWLERIGIPGESIQQQAKKGQQQKKVKQATNIVKH